MYLLSPERTIRFGCTSALVTVNDWPRAFPLLAPVVVTIGTALMVKLPEAKPGIASISQELVASIWTAHARSPEADTAVPNSPFVIG
jgi:hypothetical protein